MELTIKHLAPYLPYSLQFTDDESDPVSGATGTMLMLSNIAAWVKPDEGIQRLELPIKKHSIGKPLLRPLSMLTEEIEHEGEIITVVDYWDHLAGAVKIYNEIKNIAEHGHNDFYLPYFVHQKLIELHFDVFGLIENSLAIDKRLQE
jgi:hypothetical protein